jgi:uncharacterized protein (TIGR02246 family)
MPDSERPCLNLNGDPAPVEAFVRQLQTAIDTADAKLFNQSFARDVLWGSPFAAIVEGYEAIHAIHSRMFAGSRPQPGASRYQIEQVSYPTEDVVVAYIRRISATADASQPAAPGRDFSELALIVLARREGRWWLAAAQHLPDRRDVYAL